MKTLICAIELGTSRINAVAALRDENDKITISAIESEPNNGCVRHGYIQNIDEAAARIKNLTQKLSNRLSAQSPTLIGKAYIGIEGISIHTMPHTPSIHLGENDEVTSEVLASLHRQSMKNMLQGYDVLGVEAMYYNLDGQSYLDPTGGTGNELTAYNQLIVGRSQLKSHAKMAMERAGLEIAGYITVPLTMGSILTDDEKKGGCVLINFGAATTTVAIYKETLQHLAVIPIGSDAVTRDIMSNGLRHDEAENAKIKWSSAYPTDPGDIRPTAIEQQAIGMEIAVLNNIVQCRYEEIIVNIKHQIHCSRQEGKLEAGCIITGGACVQKGLSALLGEQLGMSVRTRTFSAYPSLPTCGCNNIEKKPRYAPLLSMLSRCIDDCEYHRPAPQPTATATATTGTPAGQASAAAAQLGSNSQQAATRPASQPAPRKPQPGDPDINLQGNKGKKGIGRFFGDLFFGMED